jgi:uncharacterized protein
MNIFINIIVQFVLLLSLISKDINDGEKTLFKTQKWGRVSVIIFIIINNSMVIINYYSYLFRPILKINGYISYIILLLIILLLFKYLIRQDIRLLGLKLNNIQNNIIPILLVAFINFIVLLLIAMIVKNGAIFSVKVIQQYLNISTSLNNIILLLVITVIGPIVEEVIYRGIFYSPYRKKYGANNAIIITSLLFAFSHYGVGPLPYIIAGLSLGYLYEKTESLIATIMAHGIYNLLFLITLHYWA